jgi:predicted nuclease of predicted toxin-antitoxin system
VKIWLDAQFSPALVPWLEKSFGLEAHAIQLDADLISAKDRRIFEAAGAAGAVVMTKDQDFVELVKRHGPPPSVVWVTVGNTSNRMMKQVLAKALPKALEQIEQGEALVEISQAAPI